MSVTISVPPQLLLERILTLEIVRVTERARSPQRASGARQRKAAAARDAMPRTADSIQGTVVIGEGERDEAPMLLSVKRSARKAARRRYRGRSARGTTLRQEHTGRDCDHGDGERHAAQCARRLYAEDCGRSVIRSCCRSRCAAENIRRLARAGCASICHHRAGADRLAMPRSSTRSARRARLFA